MYFLADGDQKTIKAMIATHSLLRRLRNRVERKKFELPIRQLRDDACGGGYDSQ
jgi:hypothetical protein